MGSEEMAREQLQTLTEPMYYLLLSLKQERYGYEIMAYIEEFTQGRVKIGPGTLYALLARFEEEGIIEMMSLEERRKNYLITSYGEELLEEEKKRLKQLIADGDRIHKEEQVEKKEKAKPRSIFKAGDSDILF